MWFIEIRKNKITNQIFYPYLSKMGWGWGLTWGWARGWAWGWLIIQFKITYHSLGIRIDQYKS